MAEPALRLIEKDNMDKSKALDAALTQIERNFELSCNVGWACYKADALEEAVRHLRRSTELNPSSPLGFWAVGVALGELGLLDEAETALLNALRIREGFRARLSLALLYMDQGRLAEAEKLHREGLAVTPNRRERVEGLANFLHDTGRREEAEELYERARGLPSREERAAKR